MDELSAISHLSDEEVLAALIGEPPPDPPAAHAAKSIEERMFQALLVTAHRLGVETQARVDSGTGVMGLLVLQILTGAQPPGCMADLSDSLGSSRQAASRLLMKLERRNLVDRTRYPDGTIKTVAPSATVLAAWDALHAPLRAVMRQMCGGLDELQKEAVVRILERMAASAADLRRERLWFDGGQSIDVALACRPASEEADVTRRSWVHVR